MKHETASWQWIREGNSVVLRQNMQDGTYHDRGRVGIAKSGEWVAERRSPPWTRDLNISWTRHDSQKAAAFRLLRASRVHDPESMLAVMPEICPPTLPGVRAAGVGGSNEPEQSGEGTP